MDLFAHSIAATYKKLRLIVRGGRRGKVLERGNSAENGVKRKGEEVGEAKGEKGNGKRSPRKIEPSGSVAVDPELSSKLVWLVWATDQVQLPK